MPDFWMQSNAAAGTVKAFTKQMLDDVLKSVYEQPVARPDIIMVAPHHLAVFVTCDTAEREQWNWRRLKRELRRIDLVRKGVRREYHRKAA